jgi:hypothetical protein
VLGRFGQNGAHGGALVGPGGWWGGGEGSIGCPGRLGS